MNTLQRLPVLLSLMVAGTLSIADQLNAQSGDEEQVREVIRTAYIDGLQKNGSREDIRRGFHPDFVMKVLGDDGMRDVAIEDWIGRLPPEGQSPDRLVTAEIPQVSVSGSAAAATVHVMFDGEHVFTDYFGLYRFADGWRIVTKIFNSEN